MPSTSRKGLCGKADDAAFIAAVAAVVATVGHRQKRDTDEKQVEAARKKQARASTRYADSIHDMSPTQLLIVDNVVHVVPFEEATLEWAIKNIRDGSGIGRVQLKNPFVSGKTELAKAMKSKGFTAIHDEQRRFVLKATLAQERACWPPEVFELAARWGVEVTSTSFVLSKANCGKQKPHRDVKASTGMTAEVRRQMEANQTIPPFSVFYTKDKSGSLWVSPGTQYTHTLAFERVSKRRKQLEVHSKAYGEGKEGYIRIEYGPGELLIINSSLFHFGDEYAEDHLRLFCIYEGGERGVHLCHVDEDGNQQIELLVMDSEDDDGEKEESDDEDEDD
jgi:hypothetical protein